MCLPLSQESRSGLVTGEQEFLSIAETVFFPLEDLVGNNDSEEKALTTPCYFKCIPLILREQSSFQRKDTAHIH